MEKHMRAVARVPTLEMFQQFLMKLAENQIYLYRQRVNLQVL